MHALTVFPKLIMLLFTLDYQVIEVILLLRIFYMRNIVNKMEDYLNMSEFMHSIFKLLKLFFIMLYIAHICGII